MPKKRKDDNNHTLDRYGIEPQEPIRQTASIEKARQELRKRHENWRLRRIAQVKEESR